VTIENIYGKRQTPTQAAKLILLDNASKAGYWEEQFQIDVDKLTPREKRQIETQLEKQFDRLQKFLGFRGATLG
jgi:hypothetical protein